MDKITELRNIVADLFSAATDKTTIEKSAVFNQKLNELEADTKAKEKEYKDLLKDYKEIVVHTSFKDKHEDSAIPETKTFDGNDFIKRFIKNKEERQDGKINN